jgi:hypothetical protein
MGDMWAGDELAVRDLEVQFVGTLPNLNVFPPTQANAFSFAYWQARYAIHQDHCNIQHAP